MFHINTDFASSYLLAFVFHAWYNFCMGNKAKETALEFARKDNYKDVEYLGKWKGYLVFNPLDDDIRIIGHPIVVLVNDGKARFSKPKESFAILAQGL